MGKWSRPTEARKAKCNLAADPSFLSSAGDPTSPQAGSSSVLSGWWMSTPSGYPAMSWNEESRLAPTYDHDAARWVLWGTDYPCLELGRGLRQLFWAAGSSGRQEYCNIECGDGSTTLTYSKPVGGVFCE